MAGTIERIERDLAAIGEASTSLKAEFHSTYSNYLTSLAQAVRRAATLASYHICTQGYPDGFLKLSFAQRQQLQKALLKLVSQATEQLLSYLATPKSEPDAGETANYEWNQGGNTNAPIGVPIGDALTDGLTNPEQLAQWQENLERAIAQTIQTLSRNGNRLLAQAGILPNRVPEAVLEAAAKASGDGEGVAGSPNLLNLLIETENDQALESSTVTQVIALHLRLSEIEFADATVMARRQQIRNLSSRLNTLRREYQKKQRERIISEAQAAWRTSWVDD